MSSHAIAPTYYNISPRVTAFSTTRHGGNSVGNYASFNINEFCGDNAHSVAANRELLARELGIESSLIVMPHQTHGTGICVIDNEYMALPDHARRTLLDGIDAMMTNLHGICIGVSTADCIPVLLYDPRHDAICAIHAGWHGTLARIVQKAVNVMHTNYQTAPTELRCIIGPGISRQNFEVGDEVYDAFKNEGFDMTSIAERHTKWHIDLPLCNHMMLEQLGVASENIMKSGICTYDHVDDYFSARRLGTESGRIFTGIMLK